MNDIKTLIELFDSCQIENVIAGMGFLPEKIVFVGFADTMTSKKISDLEKFFSLRGMDVIPEYEVVDRYDYEAIVQKLNDIIDANEDCCFDLTGGKELVLAAMGAVAAVRDIPMLQFNVRTGKLLRVAHCDCIEEPEKSSMSIYESVVLNGGCVVYDSKNDLNWDLNNDFKRDIDIIWDICRKNCRLWNRQSNVFQDFEKFADIDDACRVTVDIGYMKNIKRDTVMDKGIIGELVKNNLITDYVAREDVLSFRYKNNQVRRCLTKAGNILELYVYKSAKEIQALQPGFYNDIDIGVIVDWDGVVHDNTFNSRDTRNEIDVLLMRNLVPIFISCKNGELHKEALYELAAVAEKFGGEYVRKIIVTTYISNDPTSRKYILQRAGDMKIDIIEDVDKMNKGEFISALKKSTR